MILIYAATVTVSACLLFLVQPLITKIIFPWFGGTSAVWVAALVFFQTCLLCGYSYAHWLTTKITPRKQWLIHSVLLTLCCALMPILPSDAWRPSAADNPTMQIFLLLTATVGLPSILLSSTSPLLQVWYMRASGSGIPFWLFALSNFGSLAALLSFPLLLEPAFSSRTLAIAWSSVFVAFTALCIYVGWRRRTDAPLSETTAAEQHSAEPSTAQMVLWIFFSACASALLAASTVQLSTNVAPIPLLWVVPLAVYLLTFILNFSSTRFYHRTLFFPVVAAAIGCLAWMHTHTESNQDIRYVIPVYLICLFVICMACHGELVRRSPSPRYLTRFYLLIALGGALGGFFVSVIAPLAFNRYLELPLLLVAVAAVMVRVQWQRRGADRMLWPVRIVMVAAVMMLAGYLTRSELSVRNQNVLVTRNFYGVLRVRDYVENGIARRGLVNGTISHGYQFTDAGFRDIIGSYYSDSSPVGRTLKAMATQGPVRVGLIGLGAGMLTGYARKGDYFRVYEINRDVVRIAQQYFRFLPQARQRGADVQVLMGDARLTLERQERQNFDVLVVDAFSSDAIPTHLLTREAFALYFQHLKEDGVLAVHISNRYLDLAPVCVRGAESVHRLALLLWDSGGIMSDASFWVLITSNHGLLIHSAFKGADIEAAQTDASFHGWTDQYSSVWPVLTLHPRYLVITAIRQLGPMSPNRSN